jgi:hypothetical protein
MMMSKRMSRGCDHRLMILLDIAAVQRPHCHLMDDHDGQERADPAEHVLPEAQNVAQRERALELVQHLLYGGPVAGEALL